jgi:hypothetical protein
MSITSQPQPDGTVTPTVRPPRRIPTGGPTPAECTATGQNWSDLEHQLRHSGCCRTAHERELLCIAHEKIKASAGSQFSYDWPRLAARSSYSATASIVACSAYPGAEDCIRCGYSTFSCHDRFFCPRCCFKYFARPVLDEFGNAIGADNEVYYIVLSLSSNPDEKQRLIFKDIDEADIQNLKLRGSVDRQVTAAGCAGQDYGVEFQSDEDLRDCRLLWEFYTDAIREFTGSKGGGLFSGAMGGPELAVRFQPLRVLPHANYLAWSPGFSVDGARKLRRFIREKMRDCRRLQTKLFPSVACYRIRSGEDLRRVIKYIFKPIDLATAYMTAVDRIGHEPAAMAELNRKTDEFLKNVLDVFWSLRRVSRYGRCHANHHDYFGDVSPYRQAQRDRAAERRAGEVRGKPVKRSTNRILRWALHHMDQLERPSSSRRSKFSFWQQRNESPAPWPPRLRPTETPIPLNTNQLNING